MSSVITLGLSQIQVGAIEPDGDVSKAFKKIGKTYENTCTIKQDNAEVTEHYEEGQTAPEVRKKRKKAPVLKFSIMDPDVEFLQTYLGGTTTGEGDEAVWQWTDEVENIEYSVRVIPEVGLVYTIPRGDIEAVLNADMSSKGINLVDFTVKPLKPIKAGVPFMMAQKKTTSFPGK